MNLLPEELIIVIFELIPLITDKRQFLKTCIHYNKITKQSIFNCERNYGTILVGKQTERGINKFTLELCNDGYFNLIPDHYIIPENKWLVSHLAYYNIIPLLEIAKLKGCDLTSVSDYGALGGHISVLDWGRHNGSDEWFVGPFAILSGNINTLKWLYNNEHNFSIFSLNYAIERDKFEAVKFLHGIGCVFNNESYEMALKKDNKEIINYLLDNDCPT